VIRSTSASGRQRECGDGEPGSHSARRTESRSSKLASPGKTEGGRVGAVVVHPGHVATDREVQRSPPRQERVAEHDLVERRRVRAQPLARQLPSGKTDEAC